MRRNWRAIAAVLGLMGLAAVLLPPGANAQKVGNPGSFALKSTGGQLRIGTSLDLDLTPQPNPQCSDGIDNDGDGFADGADGQCNAGTAAEPKEDDDNELVPGFQPKVNVSITGTIDAAGNITVPAAGIVFPPAYIKITNPFDGISWYPKVQIAATAPGTGTLNPLTGDVTLNVKFRAVISGYVNGVLMNATCAIGTAASPIDLTLVTGTVPPVGNNPQLTGFKYNPTNGTAILVNNSFAVPGASGCNQGLVDLNSAINQNVGLPSGTGRNAVVLAGRADPTITRGINPAITSTPSVLNGQAPFTVAFSALTSQVAKGPATYAWTFGDGQTSTSATPSITFGAAGTYPVSLRVTDADGDFATASATVVVTPGSGSTTTTTTTTAPTTTTSTTTPTTTTTSTTTPTTTTSTTTPTTTTTSTTTPTTTTTSTTLPQPSDDTVSVKFTGAISYENSGTGTGDLAVDRDNFGLTGVKGSLNVPGTTGGTAKVTVDVNRAWILPFWAGTVTVSDPGAGVSVTTPVLGSLSRGATVDSATTTSSWFVLGTFPNLIKPYTLKWSVDDAS
jgi:PKD repeat protein